MEVDHLGVGNVAHALVVADGQRQERDHHKAAVEHVAVEEIQRIGDAHVLRGFIDVVDQRIDALGEVVGGGYFDVGAGRGLGGKVGSGFQIAGAGLGLHLVSAQDMTATLDQVGFLERQIGVAVRLVH